MAPNAKFTEQAQVTRAGEGVLWKYTTAVSPTFKLPVPDPIAGQIGMIVMLKVSGNAPGARRIARLRSRLQGFRRIAMFNSRCG